MFSGLFELKMGLIVSEGAKKKSRHVVKPLGEYVWYLGIRELLPPDRHPIENTD